MRPSPLRSTRHNTEAPCPAYGGAARAPGFTTPATKRTRGQQVSRFAETSGSYAPETPGDRPGRSSSRDRSDSDLDGERAGCARRKRARIDTLRRDTARARGSDGLSADLVLVQVRGEVSRRDLRRRRPGRCVRDLRAAAVPGDE